MNIQKIIAGCIVITSLTINVSAMNTVEKKTTQEQSKEKQETPKFKFKNDKYRRARGGKAVILELDCAKCAQFLMYYQKDGDGNLLRCYLNRICAPDDLAKLQSSYKIKKPKDLTNLNCSKCNTCIATPMAYSDGRLAYRLRQGSFKKYIVELDE
jgi:hypothetical protein